jgi:hypothetical protein
MDKVYSYEWYDGPRSGVATYNGQPHYFESQWADVGSQEQDWYELIPITRELFECELEVWELWRKYYTAYTAGTVGMDYHPFLPGDQARGNELQQIINSQPVEEGKYDLIAKAKFSSSNEQTTEYGMVAMLVEWETHTTPPSPSRKKDYGV